MLQKLCLFLIGFFLSLALHGLGSSIETPVFGQAEESIWIQQGQEFYQAENFAAAKEKFLQSTQQYQQQNDALNQALALNYLTLAEQRLGQVDAAQAHIAESLELLTSIDRSDDQQRLYAQAQTTYGQILLMIGQPGRAFEQWQIAHQMYKKLGDEEGLIGTQINQLQVLRVLGHYRQTNQQLDDIHLTLNRNTNTQLQRVGWRTLGNILQITGELDQAFDAFQNSLILARSQHHTQDMAAAWLGIGNIHWQQGDRYSSLNQSALSSSKLSCPVLSASDKAITHYQSALDAYESSRTMAQSPILRTKPRLNQFRLLTAFDPSSRLSDIALIIQDIQSQFSQLPAGRYAVEARVNFAQSSLCLDQNTNKIVISVDQIIQQLQTAIEMAISLDDPLAKSYALGTLGRVYAWQGNIQQALTHTEEAIQSIQSIQANNIAYQWHWQMAQLLKQEGDRSKSLTSYSIAFRMLQNLRQDLVALGTDFQFSFRQMIEPFYRQYADLLLQSPSSDDLVLARNILEALQLAELDNFFQDACLTAKPEQLDQIAEGQDPTAAILYPIILEDRIEVILKLPGQPILQHMSTSIQDRDVRHVLAIWQSQLVEPYLLRAAQQSGQLIYEWLIDPIYPFLKENQIKTLVFVLDTPFQNIPMGALYDGEHYLIEEFAITLAPGLQLLEPRSLLDQEVSLVSGGLTEAHPPFPPLPQVQQELEDIEAIVPSSVRLIDQDFIKSAIETVMTSASPSVVHFATHGQFSSQAEDTFILLHDGMINVNELEALLKREHSQIDNTIELLVLSACETARGDERAALGLAGVAVRAGARSTLATLWKADDRATANLMHTFYQELFMEQSENKAIALQKAQLALLHGSHFKHPRYWAPFVLLGNWL